MLGIFEFLKNRNNYIIFQTKMVEDAVDEELKAASKKSKKKKKKEKMKRGPRLSGTSHTEL